ncbi:hypothetical protein SNE40_000284 [Patella caerulea]|uniref:Uncharacterized protein n=1 Tax=Patella caerulea TaxID=87958 RepID=A0AAN8K4V9_PATCE
MADGDEEKSDKQEIADRDPIENNGVEEMEDDESDLDSVVEECSQEYQALDQTLDHLNSVLNSLEAKNDDIIARALALLQDNRDVHEQIKEERRQLDS